MKKTWGQATIQQYINDGAEESRVLEYKSADALGGTAGKKKELAKDVSAMANSAGGTIIYGIQEYQEKEKKHLPEKIDPIDRTQFSRERLEQIIADNIQPRIEGVKIHPVSIDTEPNGVVYVVEIPQGTTAHQVTADKDYRYYKRFNFQAVRMADDEIRDVMNRATTPDVQVEFKVNICYFDAGGDDSELQLSTVIKNTGAKVVNHYKLILRIANVGFSNGEGSLSIDPAYSMPKEGKNVASTYIPGYSAGMVDLMVTYRSTEVFFPDEELNLSSAMRWGYRRYWPKDDLRTTWIEFAKKQEWSLEWILYADNMPPKKDKIPISELEGF